MLVFVIARVSAWNDFSCLGCQFHGSFCLVSSRSGAAMLAKSAMKYARIAPCPIKIVPLMSYR